MHSVRVATIGRRRHSSTKRICWSASYQVFGDEGELWFSIGVNMTVWLIGGVVAHVKEMISVELN